MGSTPQSLSDLDARSKREFRHYPRRPPSSGSMEVVDRETEFVRCVLPYDYKWTCNAQQWREAWAICALLEGPMESFGLVGAALPPGPTSSRERAALLAEPHTADTDTPTPEAVPGETRRVPGTGGIYMASKTVHAPRWRELRAAGWPIISTWIDEAGKGETACFTDLWRRCVAEAAQASAVIVYREAEEVLKGAFVEVGAALTAGTRVFSVGCDEFSFVNHTRVTCCADLETALGHALAAAPPTPSGAAGDGLSQAARDVLTEQPCISTRDTFPDRKGECMQTFTGRRFWPLDPRPDDICIEDIAHALSLQTRYGGHCTRFYSVAEHSVYLARAAAPEDALWALLHDASEAYLAEVIRPLKRHLQGYGAAEIKLMGAVCARFDLDGFMPAAVKALDNRILMDERAQIMRPTGDDWHYGGETEPLGITIEGWSPEQAKREFLSEFARLDRATPPTDPALRAGDTDGGRS